MPLIIVAVGVALLLLLMLRFKLNGFLSLILFAFAASFDEVVVTLFLAGPDQTTLPRQMFAGIKENISPTIAAAATVLILFSIVLLLTLEWLRGRSEKMRTAASAA